MSLLVSLGFGCASSDPGFIVLNPKSFNQVTTSPDGGLFGGNGEEEEAQPGKPGADAVADTGAVIITPGAKLTIYVDEDSTLNQQYIVPNSGEIEFPPLGRMGVAGLKTSELAAKIKKELERDYFQTATVAVTAERTSVGGVIYVLGAVGHQGPIAIPAGEDFTVLKAILAVGTGPFSNLARVEIVRYGADGKKYKTRVNVEQIQARREFEKDIPLVSGDWMIVPEKIFNF